MPPKSKKRLAASWREAQKAEERQIEMGRRELLAQTYEAPRYLPSDPACKPYWDAFYENPYPEGSEWKGLSERLNMRPDALRLWFRKARQFTHTPARGPEDDIEGLGKENDGSGNQDESKNESECESECESDVSDDGNLLAEGTLYAHFYRNLVPQKKRPTKRARSSTVTKDSPEITQAGGLDVKKNKTTHQRGPRGPYHGQSRTTIWRNQTHARKYASDIQAFFPMANQQPESSLLVEKRADTPAEYILVDSESDTEPPVDERVPGTAAHALGSLVATEEVVTESPIMQETISLKSATNEKVSAMPLETYHKALEQLELSMSSLKLDILSQDVLSADRPIEEGPTPQDAEDELAEPLDLLEDVDEGSSDEPYHVALTRHLNRLLGLEKKSKTPNAKRLIELTMLSDYNNLRQAFVEAECKSPSMLASNRIAEAKFVPTAKKPNYQYESWYARRIRAKANYLVRVGSLPESKQGKGGVHYSLLAEEDVRRGILSYVRTLKTGRISPMRLRREVNHKLLPELGIAKSISESTARQWLLKLGYRPIKHSKGMYIDGHERSDVIEYRSSFLNSIKAMQPFIQQYDDNTDEPIPLILPDGEKRHVPVAHDESCFHANDRDALIWVKDIYKTGFFSWIKGCGRSAPWPVGGFVCAGRIHTSWENHGDQLKFSQSLRKFGQFSQVPGRSQECRVPISLSKMFVTQS